MAPKELAARKQQAEQVQRAMREYISTVEDPTLQDPFASVGMRMAVWMYVSL